MARKFLQDQQDKATKEAITKEILNDTLGKNNDLTNKLISINPELKGLADLLKSEINASLAIIIDSIVGRFLQATRTPAGVNNQQTANGAARPPLVGVKPFEELAAAAGATPPLPPMPSLKTANHVTTPSGRAPQVRDRAAPRGSSMGSLNSSHHAPVSMYNPHKAATPPVTTTASSFPLPPSLRPAPGLLTPANLHNTSAPNNNNNNMDDKDEVSSSPSPSLGSRPLSPPEQDEALSLVVTPKKRRHKVTDTRITPRTLSRVLGEGAVSGGVAGQNFEDLHKQFGAAFPALNKDGRPHPLPHPLFPGLPAPPGLLAHLPTSVAIPNPSLADFNPFSSFYSPPHLPNSKGATPTSVSGGGLPAVRDTRGPKIAPPLGVSPPTRERHHSSSDLMEDRTTPSLLGGRGGGFPRGSPDFAARLREDREREDDFSAGSFISGKNHFPFHIFSPPFFENMPPSD